MLDIYLTFGASINVHGLFAIVELIKSDVYQRVGQAYDW
ncbi:hypothetical protein predicted by Glimmer/Critica [Streptococcus dysgalactiae subsp. equisimilis AC-2713]|uniref:Uncharacterized protein n=1 Tax=Streptococcus dysgalactiae subsp. equisimilis AC-2713 TaxID=759913 RepID=A0AB33R5C8_STREQ|nr:hypothetical protein SDD27957_06085 [Streptococcus dysgalactiae subsp. dysgalactiae ATCC 27957]CCI62676.1 hypothetical protein predicted by Glimmer/Critica [Streptococcus dysgalactiae subsp. equisimilis AC-2713]